MSTDANRWQYELVPLSDGRQLEVLSTGIGTSGTLVFHDGTPGGPVPDEGFAATAEELGLRLLMPARPGYGQSTPSPSRTVADAASDVATALDFLGVGEFLNMGASGGGPHALACAALLPERCLATASVVSPAPMNQPDLDFFAGMGVENVEEWGIAVQGREALVPWMKQTVSDLGDITAQAFIDMAGSLLPPVDLAVMTGAYAELTAAGLRKALENGADGWIDDDLAMVAPWGFDVNEIATPVTVWHGKKDMMIAYTHALWLARKIPGADLHLYADHGHLSLSKQFLPAMLRDLVDKSASPLGSHDDH